MALPIPRAQKRAAQAPIGSGREEARAAGGPTVPRGGEILSGLPRSLFPAEPAIPASAGAPAVRLGVLLVLSVLWPAGPARGGEVLFQPEIFTGASYTDNALNVGEGDNETAIYRLGATFPLTAKSPRGRFRLSYSPIYERFEDFEELDNLSHYAALGWTIQPKERTAFGLRARWSRFQDHRGAERGRTAVFLREPLTRELAAVDLNFGHPISPRWRWRGGAGFSNWSFEPVDEESTLTFEDRQEVRARLGLTRQRSPGLSIGGEYGVRRFDLESSGRETAHSLSLTVDRHIERWFDLRFGIGGFVTEGDSETSESGVQGWLNLSRTYHDYTFSLLATHRPSVGGSRVGTADLSTASLGVDGDVADAWYWGVHGRWARREPRLEMQPRIQSVSGDGYIERRFAQLVGIVLGLGYAEQTSDDPAQEGDVYRADLSLVLYPLGRTKLGGYRPPEPEPPEPPEEPED